MRAKAVAALLSFVFGVVAPLVWADQFAAQALSGRDIPLPVLKAEALKLKIPADIEKGAVVFAGCQGCHETGAGAVNRVGPVLNGVVGRAAGSVSGYDYSSALVRAGKSGLVWTRYKLDAFLMGPNKFLAGNKMPYVGIKDEAARRDLIGYLATLQ